MSGPLAGVRVVDLTRVLAGPYATMLLGDLGADVIKVEPPAGDDTRQWRPPSVAGESTYYLGVNRNKRSVVLDLGSEDGRLALRALAASADVLIENFKVGTMERWGLGYEEVLRPLNPGLVYCSITGYGRTGPSAHLPGYDTVIEAMGGLMSLTGEPEGEPMKVGVAIVDVVTGSHAAFGVCAALTHRLRTGEGQRVDLSLFESNLSALANQASAYLLSGEIPGRHGNAHSTIVPYQVFRARDASVMVAVGNDPQFVRLCGLLGLSDLAADPRYATNPERVRHRDELVPRLAAAIAGMEADALVAGAEKGGVPVARINDLAGAFSHPQVAARAMIQVVEHPTAGPLRMAGIPLKLDRTPGTIRRPPPLLGEHTGEVLAELGLQADGDGVVREPPSVEG